MPVCPKITIFLEKKLLKNYGFLTNNFSEQTILLYDRSVKTERNRWKMKNNLENEKNQLFVERLKKKRTICAVRERTNKIKNPSASISS